nr:MAG TPA: Thioredoxin domain [Caudoviricetes sp.]
MDTWYPGCVTCDTQGFRGLNGECQDRFDSGPANDAPLWWGRKTERKA